MELVYYTPHRLYADHNMSATNPVQASFAQMFNASISLLDRSGVINCPPIPMKCFDPITAWSKPRSFEDIARDRFDTILRTAMENNQQLVIFYSGGIDSTLIAALAISHDLFAKTKHRMLLVLTEDSIKENPKFWYDCLIPAFGTRFANAANFHSLIADPNNLCLTGEFADNIFGSLTVKSYMDATGDQQAIHKPFSKTGRDWMLAKITDQSQRTVCQDLMERLFAVNPRGCSSNHDCFWWLNFVLKWQAVKFRLVSHAPSPDLVDAMAKRVVHFFETQQFQDWAVLTDEQKVLDDWFSYKLPAKQMIYAVNHDIEYFKYKTKYPSIPSLTRYANMHDFIYYDQTTDKYTASKNLLDSQ